MVRCVFELGTDGPGSILVAVDGSDTSLRAGSYAAGLARRQGAELIVVFVHTAGAAGSRADLLVAAQEAQEQIVAGLRDNARSRAEELNLRLSFHERSGNPYTEIVKLADELRVDGVVVGASTQAGHRFVGSLAARLVRQARWPVTVVP
jgi:nucleotide-binding universal stress UspA family protein